MTPQLAPLAWLFIAMGAAAGLWLAVIRVRRWWRRGGEDMGRIAREAAADRRPVTRAMDLAGLVISPELERYAAWRASQAGSLARARGGLSDVVCTRCARGDTRLPCACGGDCYAVECLGGLSG